MNQHANGGNAYGANVYGSNTYDGNGYGDNTYGSKATNEPNRNYNNRNAWDAQYDENANYDKNLQDRIRKLDGDKKIQGKRQPWLSDPDSAGWVLGAILVAYAVWRMYLHKPQPPTPVDRHLVRERRLRNATIQQAANRNAQRKTSSTATASKQKAPANTSVHPTRRKMDTKRNPAKLETHQEVHETTSKFGLRKRQMELRKEAMLTNLEKTARERSVDKSSTVEPSVSVEEPSVKGTLVEKPSLPKPRPSTETESDEKTGGDKVGNATSSPDEGDNQSVSSEKGDSGKSGKISGKGNDRSMPAESQEETPRRKGRTYKRQPVQVLCDVLTDISGKTVMIYESDVGEVWKPRVVRSDGILKWTLQKIPAAWADLEEIKAEKIIQPNGLRETMQWTEKAERMRRDGLSPFPQPGDEGFVHVAAVLRNLATCWMQSVIQTMQIYMATVDESDDEDDDFLWETLFDEDYSQTKPKADDISIVKQFTQIIDDTLLPLSLGLLFSLRGGAALAGFVLQMSVPSLNKESFDDSVRQTMCVGNLLLSSPALASALRQRLVHELSKAGNKLGKDFEKSSLMKDVFKLSAFIVPEVGMETSGRSKNEFIKQLKTLRNFPTCLYSKSVNDRLALHKLNQRLQSQMSAVRKMGMTVLQKFGKDELFQWLSHLSKKNDAIAGMLKGDLLSADGVAAVCSSRSFLLGSTSAALSLCCDSLVLQFGDQGSSSFDMSYLSSKRMGLSEDTHFLIKSKEDQREPSRRTQFKGSTEFFFLLSSLIRISFHAALRVESEFNQRYWKLLESVASLTTGTQLPLHQSVIVEPVVAASLGWQLYLSDTEVMGLVTKFSILQLQWLLSVGSDHWSLVPDWMCKVPAQLLAHVVRTNSAVLKPILACKVIECSTQLLQLGTNPKKGEPFSPVVMADLVSIVDAFVKAGVNRAKRRELRKFRRRSFGQVQLGDDDDNVDTRSVDIYSSFDANDLGVTVFTNRLVCTQLCPTLMQTFGALDIIEGLDVDREHGFDKFRVKARIADLLLRLWSHPNGECRRSIIQANTHLIGTFVKSVAAAIGYLLDDACHRLVDVCKSEQSRPRDLRSRQWIESQGTSACSWLQWSRCLLMLLCELSKDNRIAMVCGSGENSVANDLATMIIHFIDKLTNEEGGTSSDLDFDKDATSQLSKIQSHSDPSRRQKLSEAVMKARYKASERFGLDVSELCHQFFALATCWHRASIDPSGESILAKRLAGHDDFQLTQFRNIYRRLIAARPKMHGKEGENSRVISICDGYVDNTLWVHNYDEREEPGSSSASKKQLKRLAKMDRMAHQEISAIASNTEIERLLDKLETIETRFARLRTPMLSNEELRKFETDLLLSGKSTSEADYGKTLVEWIVSSREFSSSSDATKFEHYFDSAARGRTVQGSGKTLVKEARRCYKTLPMPHPNSATFICYAEERMDLCRAAITGPVDTPYAYGFFVFDVFFPPNYPNIPPLVTFMTTGGGQTRFNPNLYQDGKVCLSLLGTWHAADESQKWQPSKSSLAQVLLSIQTQLLVEEPYFNEPGYESQKATQQGKDSSRKYNMELRLATLRHAILDPLKNPPKGFEEVCKLHFMMCRKRLLVLAQTWMAEARTTNLSKRFERCYNELVQLLHHDLERGVASLPLTKEGLRDVAKTDGEMAMRLGAAQRYVLLASRKSDHSVPATTSTAGSTTALNLPYNPWAGDMTPSRCAAPKKDDEEYDPDDELYL